MTFPLRLSPSGPVLGAVGAGFRLRLTEMVQTMTGDTVIDSTPQVLADGGWAAGALLEPVLLACDPDLSYRAECVIDVSNDGTNVAGEVTLYLDVSVDGGAFNNVVKNNHLIAPNTDGYITARQVRINMPLTTGLVLGIAAGTQKSLRFRCRVGAPVGGGLHLSVYSAATSGGGEGAVAGLEGSNHLQLEECL